LADFIVSFFGDSFLGHILATFFISMVPILELRGALPIGVRLGLDPLVSLGVSFLGNIVPVPFIIIFIRRIFGWLRGKSSFLEKVVKKLEDKATKNSDMVHKYELFGLYILVAIPLPGTGAWTGALVAALLDMQLKRAFPPIALGVLTAGIIVLLITYGVTAII